MSVAGCPHSDGRMRTGRLNAVQFARLRRNVVSLSSSDRPSVSPFEAMTRHWLVVLVVLAVAMLAGVGAAFVLPTTHRAEARLAVAPDGNNAYTIPGFPLAARELAADYARWVQNTSHEGADPAGEAVNVTASPIPDSGVIRIEAEAASPEEAVAAASEVAEQLEAAVREARKDHDPQVAYERFSELAPQVAQAQAGLDAAESAYGAAVAGGALPSQVQAAAAQLAVARTRLAEIQLQQNAAGELYRKLYSDTMGVTQLAVISPAAPAGDNRSALVQRGAVLGLGVGFLLALLLSFHLERRADGRPGSTSSASTADGRAAVLPEPSGSQSGSQKRRPHRWGGRPVGSSGR